MKVLLCVAVLLAGALAASAIDTEQHINEALAEANMELSVAAAGMDTGVNKRGVCAGSNLMSVAMCFANFAKDLTSKVEGMEPCEIRTFMLNELNGCASKYGCENNTQIRNAIRTGMQRFDQNMKAIGITC